jgi:hypothetical protein
MESELMAESVPLRILVADWILSNIQIRDNSYTIKKHSLLSASFLGNPILKPE